MQVLVIESEPDELLAQTGQSHARDFGAELLRLDKRVEIEIGMPYTQRLVGASLDHVDAVVFPGAGVAWSADDPRAEPLQHAMQTVFAHGLPCFGSCMGLQLAAVVLGGQVATGPAELGVAKSIRLTEEGRSHPLMAGRMDVFSAPTVHADQVTRLPRDARLLAANEACPTQAFAYETGGVDFWGVEYHPEISAANIGHYLGANEAKFPDSQSLIADLLLAERDPQPAGRLGTTPAEMAHPTRTLELRNWLEHVRGRLV